MGKMPCTQMVKIAGSQEIMFAKIKTGRYGHNSEKSRDCDVKHAPVKKY